LGGPSHLRAIRFYAGAAAVTWTAVAVVSFASYSSLAHRGVVALAVAQARASFQKDLAYRRWAAQRGGVYVPLSADTPPNAYLHTIEREITTPSGRALTLVNPAYMTRQVLEQERSRGGAIGRITSAHPLRPENAPDAWEAGALAKIEAGAVEVVEVVEEVEPDAPLLRYMGRLTAEERCLSCHFGQGLKAGDLRGGISIVVPMPEYFAVADAQIERVGLGHSVVWVLGVFGIAMASARASRRVREREREREAREALEQELAHARRLEAIGRLAGGVAHDLNNLLSPILGNAALALERVPAGELRVDLEDIRDAALRARELTQQLLAFGRKQMFTLEPIDPTEAVEGVVPMIRLLVGGEVELRTELARDLPAIRADRAHLGAALLNLAANARDAMPSGGVLRVATALDEVDGERARRLGLAPGRHVSIFVSDTGAGIDEATRARLFEPFFTTKPAGNGLGLASAHGTVRQLGGAIEVESAPGRGSTFRVVLPAMAQAPIATPVPAATSSVPRGTETVLLAEDEPAVRRAATSVLTGLGYRVLAARDADEALLLAARGPEIHALVTDLCMPRVGGRELHAKLAGVRPALPTVFMTGFAGDALGPGDPLPLGAAVVQKPFTPGDLGGAVRRVLDAAIAAQPPSPPSAASRS